MNIKSIIENEELLGLLNTSIEKTYYKYKLSFIIDKEDFIQEVYIFLIPRLKKFDIVKASLKTYIPLIVMSCAKNCIQSANGQSKNANKLEFKNSTFSLDYDYDFGLDKNITLYDIADNTNNIDKTDIKLIIDEILNSNILSEKQRTIVLLKSKGYTTTDIANMLNRTTSSINITFQRAKEKIVLKYAL